MGILGCMKKEKAVEGVHGAECASIEEAARQYCSSLYMRESFKEAYITYSTEENV